MKYKNLEIIGTSHIARQSVNSVKKAITQGKPEIVAIELDRNRLQGLMSSQKRKVSIADITKIGFKGFLFSWIGSLIQKKLGDYVGVAPGSEMKTAVRLAKKHNAKLALIDQDIEITLKRFSSSITWKERWNFVVDIFKGVILRKNEMKSLGIEKFDLSKVPEKQLIKKMLEKMRERYPNVCRTLIDERNIIMAKRLAMLIEQNPEKNIVAVVGAGHEEEMIRLIKKYTSSNVDYSFTFSYS
ncbi:MAG: TraB/GumN family protein [Candidatus Nanoarchaeia archaeon]|nr:TraB/GumN family protein [Candidatus Nanoarchaeia archaeon]